jgi:hypothetical protein
MDAFEGRTPFYYLLKLMVLRGGTSFTMSIDLRGGPLLLCT